MFVEKRLDCAAHGGDLRRRCGGEDFGREVGGFGLGVRCMCVRHHCRDSVERLGIRAHKGFEDLNERGSKWRPFMRSY